MKRDHVWLTDGYFVRMAAHPPTCVAAGARHSEPAVASGIAGPVMGYSEPKLGQPLRRAASVELHEPEYCVS